MKRSVMVSLILLIFGILTFYSYCYVKEHIFYSAKQESLKRTDEFIDYFTLSGKCKAVNYDNFVPYVSVKHNAFDALSVAVNQGYDTLQDCMAAIDRIQLVESEEKVQIFMKNGQMKEIKLIHLSGGR